MNDKKAKVLLIVEDDPSMLRLFHDSFSLRGFEVEDAHDGEEGLVRAGEVMPAVILLDVMMPKLDGISVLKKLKANPNTRDIPVIMLTNIASGSLGVDEEALELGAVKYIVKSDYEPDKVVDLVEEVLRETDSSRQDKSGPKPS